MLSLRSVTLRRGPRALFSDASFTLYAGEKVGVVGANGSGKSSLFALIAGELAPDAGAIEIPASLALASVAQDEPPAAQPAIECVLDGDAQLRATERALQDA